jgi:hypothetical protein
MIMTDLKFKDGEVYLCYRTSNESWFTLGTKYTVVKGHIKDNVGDEWGWVDAISISPNKDFAFGVETEADNSMKMTDLTFKDGETYICNKTENASWFTVGKEYAVSNEGIKDDVGDVWGLNFRHVDPGGDFFFELKDYKTKIDMRNPDGSVDAAKSLAYIEAVGAVFPPSIKQFITTMPFLYLDKGTLTWGSGQEHFDISKRIEVNFEYEINFTITPKTKQQALRTKLNKNILELEAQLIEARIELDNM